MSREAINRVCAIVPMVMSALAIVVLVFAFATGWGQGHGDEGAAATEQTRASQRAVSPAGDGLLGHSRSRWVRSSWPSRQWPTSSSEGPSVWIESSAA